MLEFKGTKFRPFDDNNKVVYDIWGNKTIKQGFIPTSSYTKYLKDKYEIEALQELKTMKNKLDYQLQTYGEVDEIDLKLYEYKLKQAKNFRIKKVLN